MRTGSWEIKWETTALADYRAHKLVTSSYLQSLNMNQMQLLIESFFLHITSMGRIGVVTYCIFNPSSHCLHILNYTTNFNTLFTKIENDSRGSLCIWSIYIIAEKNGEFQRFASETGPERLSFNIQLRLLYLV